MGAAEDHLPTLRRSGANGLVKQQSPEQPSQMARRIDHAVFPRNAEILSCGENKRRLFR